MTKIRNAIFQQNCYCYAGPVEGGSGGSRKTPESFSGASPPGLFQPHYSICACVGKFKNFVAKVVFTVGIAFMLAISVVGFTACDDGTGDNTGPTEPTLEGVSTANDNLEFGEINTAWSQADVNARVRMATGFLAKQARDIADQYDAWYRELAPTKNSYNLLEVSSKMDFANYIKSNENGLNYALQRNNAGDDKTSASQSIQQIGGGVVGMCSGVNNRNLADAKLLMFRLATYMDTRQHATAEEQAFNQSELERYANYLRQECNYSIQIEDVKAIIQKLRNEVQNMLPEKTGPPSTRDRVFIKQFEDYAQWDGWTDDLKALGYDLSNIPMQSVIIFDNYKPEQDTRTREQMQKDNGMWW